MDSCPMKACWRLGLLVSLGSAWLTACERSPRSSAGGTAATVQEIVTPTDVTMVLIPAGSFLMGSAGDQGDASPSHRVAVSAFVMDKYEVTQDLLASLELPNPSHFKGPRRPVEQIRWAEAALFCNERSRADGLQPCYDEDSYACDFKANGYRLPTEAEWEYAARAGVETHYSFGNSPSDLGRYACYSANSKKKTESVGLKKPNGWELYDMHGNVAEWCNDIYSATYYRESPVNDPTGPTEGKKRVLRGGSWRSSEDACQLTARLADLPGIADACFAQDSFGFRCVRRLSAEEQAHTEGIVARGDQPN